MTRQYLPPSGVTREWLKAQGLDPYRTCADAYIEDGILYAETLVLRDGQFLFENGEFVLEKHEIPVSTAP